MMYKIGLALLLLVFGNLIFGQQPGGITPSLVPGKGGIMGKIVEKSTGQPVAFANVATFRSGNPEILTGINSEEDGSFILSELDYGRYDLIISFLGYEELIIKNIEISSQDRLAKLGEVILTESVNQLQEVQVTAERELIQMGLDKKVYNVSRDLSSTGGDASEVLKNIPSVTVDVDGNVSLRGSENVRIMIDGRPSGLVGMDRRAVLQQLPAGMIEAVEVMTNPSAKYSPEGMSGIINIITKKQNKKGFNLIANVNAGTNGTLDGGLNLNYRTGKFNFFSNYSARYSDNWRRGISERQTFLADTTFFVDNYSDFDNRRMGHTINGGLDFYLHSKSVLSANATFSPRQEKGEGINEFFYSDYQDRLTLRSNRFEVEQEDEQTFEMSLNFNHSFKKQGHMLNLTINHSENPEVEKGNFEEYFLTPAGIELDNPLFQKSVDDANNSLSLFQGDYVLPIAEKWKLESGFRSTFQNQKNDYRLEDFDPATSTYLVNDTFSNRFDFTEDIHALYTTFSGAFKKFEFQAGILGEQTNINPVLLLSNQEFPQNYFYAFPSASFAYVIEGFQKVQLSYSKRINRPNVRSMIPVPDFGNRLDIRTGNPALKPELIHSYEIEYLNSWDIGSLNASLFYRQMDDLITRLVEVQPDGRRLIMPTNLLSGKNYGLELVGTLRPYKFWNMNASFSYYRNEIDGQNIEADLNNSGYQWNTRLISNFTFWKDLNMQWFTFYRSRGVTAQGEMYPFFWMDFGFRKPVFKGKGAVNFRISDLFNTRRFKHKVIDTDQIAEMEFRRQSQAFVLGFSYQFGQMDNKRRQKNGQEGREFDDDFGF